MNKIDTFSIRRVWLLCKYELNMERARITALLRTFTIMMALPFGYGLITEASYSEYCNYCFDFFDSTQTTMLIVYSATIFSIIEHSGTNYFMLPALNSEKLTAQVLFYTVGTLLLFSTTYIILEALHYPIVTLLDKPEEFRQSIAPLFFNLFIFKGGWRTATYVLLFGITIYNCYVNIRCRGHNWFVGSLLMLVIVVALMLIAGGIIKYCTITIPDYLLMSVTIITLSILNYFVWRNSLKNFGKLAII